MGRTLAAAYTLLLKGHFGTLLCNTNVESDENGLSLRLE